MEEREGERERERGDGAVSVCIPGGGLSEKQLPLSYIPNKTKTAGECATAGSGLLRASLAVKQVANPLYH